MEKTRRDDCSSGATTTTCGSDETHLLSCLTNTFSGAASLLACLFTFRTAGNASMGERAVTRDARLIPPPPPWFFSKVLYLLFFVLIMVHASL